MPTFMRGPIPSPPAEFRELVHGAPINEEEHDRIGRIVLEMVKQHCCLEPSSVVLDIGCGCSRAAQPMTGYLTAGTWPAARVDVPRSVDYVKIGRCQPNHEAAIRRKSINIPTDEYVRIDEIGER